MRVLLLNQFYPPDVAPTGRFLHELALALLARGHTVEVICSQGSYAGGGRLPPRQRLDGVEVRRVAAGGFGGGHDAGRALGHAAFLAGAAVAVRRRLGGCDLLMALTTPPFLGLPAGWLARRAGVPCAHWTMDVYPDALTAAGILRDGTRARRALERLARSQYRGAALALSLGPHMSRRVARLLGPGVRSEWVPLWGRPPVADDAAARLRERRGWAANDTVLLYSGNLGRGHRFEEFAAAAARLGGEGPIWAFAGGGPRRAELAGLAAAHPGARIELLPYVPDDQVAASHAAADVHLVSLSEAWGGVIVPSKVPAALAAGRPVIYVGPDRCEPAEWIAGSGGGWCVAEGDVEALLAAVAQARDPAERARRGAAGRAFARIHFDRDRNCGRIAGLLEECAGPGAASG